MHRHSRSPGNIILVLLHWLTRFNFSLQFQADFAVVSTGLYATPFVPQFEASHVIMH